MAELLHIRFLVQGEYGHKLELDISTAEPDDPETHARPIMFSVSPCRPLPTKDDHFWETIFDLTLGQATLLRDLLTALIANRPWLDEQATEYLKIGAEAGE